MQLSPFTVLAIALYRYLATAQLVPHQKFVDLAVAEETILRKKYGCSFRDLVNPFALFLLLVEASVVNGHPTRVSENLA